jgi:hypothetical protein
MLRTRLRIWRAITTIRFVDDSAVSETVNWFVLKRWAELSEEQLESFRKVLGNDFRPLQTRNGRVVKATPRGPF